MERAIIKGIVPDTSQAKVTLSGVRDEPGLAAKVFRTLADAAINVDMIVQNVSHGSDTPSTDLSFTIDKPDVAKAQSVIDGMRGDISFGEALADENIGKLSIVGVGMRSHSGIAAKVFEVLAAAGVNIQMISTSEIKISVVIGIDKAEEATRAVHDAFLG